jgi:hypothetical protein
LSFYFQVVRYERGGAREGLGSPLSMKKKEKRKREEEREDEDR